MKLEVGNKYRTVDGTIVTVTNCEGDSTYPFRVECGRDSLLYTKDGFYYSSKIYCGYNIIEEIQENTMFNENYKYLCMDADGYNKASINKPTINTDMQCWEGYDLLVQQNFFNLGDDWKESLREIVYNDDGSIYLRKPRHEFKVDDKVLVRGIGESKWRKRYFSHWDCNGKPRCFSDGTTSFSANSTNIWDEIKPYDEE